MLVTWADVEDAAEQLEETMCDSIADLDWEDLLEVAELILADDTQALIDFRDLLTSWNGDN